MLSGQKTYIVAGLIMASAIAEIMGYDLPYMTADDAGKMLMEGLALIFVRLGIAKNNI